MRFLSLQRYSDRLREIAGILRELSSLSRRGRLGWLLRLERERALYTFKAVYSGMCMNRAGHGMLSDFRRCIHRLEKGLLLKNRRSVFAEDYIQETVEYLGRLKASPDGDLCTIAWGEAVLEEYFKATNHTAEIAEAYRRYGEIKPDNKQPTWQPYRETQRPGLAVSYEALHALALRRRSVRIFLDRTVDFGVVREAMRVAALSPSACNRQSFHFLFYNDKEIVGAISELPGGCAGYELPSIVVVTGSYRGYFDERDMHVPLVDASLAVMSFLFALETLGLSSVCLNWPSLPDRDEALRRIVDLEDDEIVVMLVGIGYPDPEGKVAYSAKRDVADLLRCNERLVAGTTVANTRS